MEGREDVQTTNPLKKALIQPIISVCGTIIVIFPFIIPIIPSIAAGSVIGFAGGCPLLSGFLRYAPDWNAETRVFLRASKAASEITFAFWRKVMPRWSERCSRRESTSSFFGVEEMRTVT